MVHEDMASSVYNVWRVACGVWRVVYGVCHMSGCCMSVWCASV
jgi:hypothetical protein